MGIRVALLGIATLVFAAEPVYAGVSAPGPIAGVGLPAAAVLAGVYFAVRALRR
jgi:hypothetical protein